MRALAVLVLVMSSGCGHVLAEMRAEEDAQDELDAVAEAHEESDRTGGGTLDSVAASTDTWEQKQQLAIAERTERAETRAASMRAIGQALQSMGNGLGQMARSAPPVYYVAPPVYVPPATVHCTSMRLGFTVNTTCR